MSFKDKLEHGKVAESHLTRYLMRHGCSVQPCYEIEENQFKGPILSTPEGEDLVLPDRLAYHKEKKQHFYAECKSKSGFTWYRKDSVFETGIDHRHYLDYRKVEVVMGIEVCMFFLHEGKPTKDCPYVDSPSGLFYAPLSKLVDNEGHRSDRWGNGMVYWRREDDGGPLRRIASWEEAIGMASDKFDELF